MGINKHMTRCSNPLDLTKGNSVCELGMYFVTNKKLMELYYFNGISPNVRVKWGSVGHWGMSDKNVHGRFPGYARNILTVQLASY